MRGEKGIKKKKKERKKYFERISNFLKEETWQSLPGNGNLFYFTLVIAGSLSSLEFDFEAFPRLFQELTIFYLLIFPDRIRFPLILKFLLIPFFLRLDPCHFPFSENNYSFFFFSIQILYLPFENFFFCSFIVFFFFF